MSRFPSVRGGFGGFGGRDRSGLGGTEHPWMHVCEKCDELFLTKASLEAHDQEEHPRGSFTVEREEEKALSGRDLERLRRVREGLGALPLNATNADLHEWLEGRYRKSGFKDVRSVTLFVKRFPYLWDEERERRSG